MLKERGPLPVYQVVKELRAAYGAVQCYIKRLMKQGKIYTVKVGARRYAALNGQDWLKAVRVEDVLEELNAALRRAEIKPETPLPEALKTLERTDPHAAEALMHIAATLHRATQ